MAVPIAFIAGLIKDLSPVERMLLSHAAKTGAKNLIKSFAQEKGYAKITDDEVDELSNTIDEYSNAEKKAQAHLDWNDRKKRKEDMRMIRNIMVDSPQKLALKTLVSGLGEGFNAAGDIAANNGNRLAAAILTGRRSGSDAQEARFGKSLGDKSREAWAQNRIRKSENLGRGLHAVGNVLNKALGTYNIQDDTAKSMQAGRMMGGTPGTLYQMIASNNARTRHLGL